MYYFIHNTEDWLRVDGPYTAAKALEEIAELTSEDIDPEYRAIFRDTPPDEYTDPREYFILNGEPVIPREVAVVTRHAL